MGLRLRFSALVAALLSLLMVVSSTSAVSAENSAKDKRSEKSGETIDIDGIAVSMDELTPVGKERKTNMDKSVTRGDQMKRVPTKDSNGRATKDAQLMLDSAASEGSLVDLATLVLTETDSGLLVTSGPDMELESVTHEQATVEQTYVLAEPAENGATQVTASAHEESMGVSAVHKESKRHRSDGVNVPLGPGSLDLDAMHESQCFQATGSRRYNIMNWCYRKYFVDGGNGRKAYGVRDDDGSNTRDFYAYKRWAQVQPDLTPVRDYAVMEAHVFSWPTWNTHRHRLSQKVDWTPTNSECLKDTSFSIGIANLSWSTPGCSAYTDISIAANDGRMKHYYKCTICNTKTKKVGFNIGVKVKQGTIPYWHDDNYAAFRQAFTYKWDYIDA